MILTEINNLMDQMGENKKIENQILTGE